MSINKRKKRKRNREEQPRVNLKERMSEILELPKEIILDVPKLSMIGIHNLVIENYKGVIEYDHDVIRLNTNAGIIKIAGEKLEIKEITAENIMIDGQIGSLEFLK